MAATRAYSVDPNGRRYATWRNIDRGFSKVHLLGADSQPLCGRMRGREMGRPEPPFPESALCQDCLKHDA
jgi:hypothetical protein